MINTSIFHDFSPLNPSSTFRTDFTGFEDFLFRKHLSQSDGRQRRTVTSKLEEDSIYKYFLSLEDKNG